MRKKLELVIVDDEIQITELIKTFIQLASKNTNIHTFSDAGEARTYLLKNSVDVLITDYKMPKYNGLELMEGLGPNVKKILISGHVSEIAEEKLSKMDAIFFEKPIPLKALSNIVTEQEEKLN